MAIIIPYGDPQAHGSIGGSVSFRRRFGRVIFEKKPEPKQPNSQAQLDQRAAFKAASDAWYGYDAASKLYFFSRAPQLGMTARNLFISATLQNIMPSQDKMIWSRIDTTQLQNLRSTENQGIRWTLHEEGSGSPANRIFDYENINEGLGSGGTLTGLTLQIYRTGTIDVHYLFRDSIHITITLGGPDYTPWLIRIPATLISNIVKFFFIAADGSAYTDIALTHLAATNNF
jgi:hypothetical protein